MSLVIIAEVAATTQLIETSRLIVEQVVSWVRQVGEMLLVEGGGAFGSRQTTSSAFVQSPLTSPSSLKTQSVSGPLSPPSVRAAASSGGGSSSMPRQSDRKTGMSERRTAEGDDLDHDLHQELPGRSKAPSHSHGGTCGSQQRQRCFDCTSPHSSVKSSESPPVSPGGRRRHRQRTEEAARGSIASPPPSPAPLVPCSSLGKSPRTYISPRGVCGVSYTGSLSPLGSARSPFSPGHQAFSARGGGGGGHGPTTSPTSGGGGGGLLASPRSAASILMRSSPDPRTISMASAVSAGVAASVAVAVAAATRQRNEGGEGGSVSRDIPSPRIRLADDDRNGFQRGSTPSALTQGDMKPVPDHAGSAGTSSSFRLDSKKSPRKGDETASRCGVSTESRGAQAPQSLIPGSSSSGVSSDLNPGCSGSGYRKGEDSRTPRSIPGRTGSESVRTPRVACNQGGGDTGTGETDPHSEALSSDARGRQREGDVGNMNRQSTLPSVDDVTRDSLEGGQPTKASAPPRRDVAMLHQESYPPSRDVSDTISCSRGSFSEFQHDERAEPCTLGERQASTAPREESFSPAREERGGEATCEDSDSSSSSSCGGLSHTTHGVTTGEGRDSSAVHEDPEEGGREERERQVGGKGFSSSPVQVTLKEMGKPVSEDDEKPERRQDRKIQTARGSRPTSSYGAGSEDNSSSSGGSGSFSVSGGGGSRFARSNSFSGGIPDNTNSPQLSAGGRPAGEAEGERGATFRNITNNNVNSHGRSGTQSPFSLSSSFSSVSVAELRKAFESRHSQHSFKKTPSIPSPPSISRAVGGGGGAREGRGTGPFSTAGGGKDSTSSAGSNSHETVSKTRMFLRSFSSSLESSSGRFSPIEGRGGSSFSFLPHGRGGGEGEDGERGERGMAVSGTSSYDENSSSERASGHHEDDKAPLFSPSLLSVSSREGRDGGGIPRDSRQGQHRTFFSNTGQVSRMVLSLSSAPKSSQYEDDRRSSGSSSNSRLGSSKYSHSSHEGGSHSGCDEDEVRGHVEERMKKNAFFGVRKLNSLNRGSSNASSADTNTAVDMDNKPSPLSTRKGEVSSVPEEGMVSLSLSASSPVGDIAERGRKAKERGEGDTKRDGGGVGSHEDERGRIVPPFRRDITEMKKPGSEAQSHSDEGRRSVPVFTRQALFGDEDGDERLPSNREKKRREQGGDDSLLDHDESESHTQRRRRPDESGDPEREEGLHKKKGRRLEEHSQLEKKDDSKEGTGGKHPSGEGDEERKKEGIRRSEGSRTEEREKGHENAEALRGSVGLVQSSSVSSLSSGEVRLPQQDLGLNLSFSFSSYPSSESVFSSSSASNSSESFSHGPTSQARHTLIVTQAETTPPPAISEECHPTVSAASCSSSSSSRRSLAVGGSEGDHQGADFSRASASEAPSPGETRSHPHASSSAASFEEGGPGVSHAHRRHPHQDPNAPLAYYVLGTTPHASTVISQRGGGVGFDSSSSQREDGEQKEEHDRSSFEKASVKEEMLGGGGGEEGWWGDQHFSRQVDLLQHKERLVQLGLDPSLVLRGDRLVSSLSGTAGGGYDYHHLSGSKYDSVVESSKQRRREGRLSSLPTATTTDSFEGDPSSLPFISAKKEVHHDDCTSFSTSPLVGTAEHYMGREILKFAPSSASSVVEKPQDKEDVISRQGSSGESRESLIRSFAGAGEECSETSGLALPMIAVVAKREENRRGSSDIAMTTLSTVSTEESLRDLPRIQPPPARTTPADDVRRGEEAGGNLSSLLELLQPSAESANAGNEESREKKEGVSNKPVGKGDDAHRKDHLDDLGDSPSFSSVQQGKASEGSRLGRREEKGDISYMSSEADESERTRVVKKNDESSLTGECSSRGVGSDQVKRCREEEKQQQVPGNPSSRDKSPVVGGREEKEQEDETSSNGGVSMKRSHMFGEVDDEGKGVGEKEQVVDVHKTFVSSRDAVCQCDRGLGLGGRVTVECFDLSGKRTFVEECVPLIKSEEGRTSALIPLKSEQQVVHPYITITNHYQSHIPPPLS